MRTASTERGLHIRAEKSDETSLYCRTCATKFFSSANSSTDSGKKGTEKRNSRKLNFRAAATKKKSDSNEFLATISFFTSLLIELVKVLAAILTAK